MTEQSEALAGGVEPRLARHGRVAYLAIPARDPITSGVFYEAVFGWTLSPQDDQRVWQVLESGDNERVPFTDTPEGLSGAFVASRGPSRDGVLLHIYVDDIEDRLREIESRGCEVVKPLRAEGGVRVAEFRDPGGNIVGLLEATRG